MIPLRKNQVIIFYLETQVEEYEKKREKFIKEGLKHASHHINGIIEGLNIALDAIRNIYDLRY